MVCPNIYLGNSIESAPSDPYWGNPAIVPPATVTEANGITIPVTVRNHGDAAPATSLELYWSDPTTGFIALPSRRIGTSFTFASIPAATAVPPADGSATHAFAWVPPAEAATLNGGHVCLLARARMEAPPGARCMQQSYTNTPQTDPRSAIRNIHVVQGMRRKAFAFAATNLPRQENESLLFIRPRDPKVDRRRLEALAEDPLVHELLAHRQVRFVAPAAVRVGHGREQLQIPYEALEKELRVPTFTRLGPMDEQAAAQLLEPGGKLIECLAEPVPLALKPLERRLMTLHVEMRDVDHAAYVVDVEHRGADGAAIGGLTVIFVAPHDFFRG